MMREAKQGHQNIVIFYSLSSATCNKLLDWKATKSQLKLVPQAMHRKPVRPCTPKSTMSKYKLRQVADKVRNYLQNSAPSGPAPLNPIA